MAGFLELKPSLFLSIWPQRLSKFHRDTVFHGLANKWTPYSPPTYFPSVPRNAPRGWGWMCAGLAARAMLPLLAREQRHKSCIPQPRGSVIYASSTWVLCCLCVKNGRGLWALLGSGTLDGDQVLETSQARPQSFPRPAWFREPHTPTQEPSTRTQVGVRFVSYFNT